LSRKKRIWAFVFALLAVAAVIAVWKPYVLIQGLQRGGLYALITLPMALILGVVGIVNLAHGEFMMLGAYFAYWMSASIGIDPLVAMIPTFAAFLIVGALTYFGTIKPVLKAPELNQLLITFGLAMALTELANLLWTSRPRKLPLPYAYSSATIGHVTFGTFGFAYLAGALVLLFLLLWFLSRTRSGQAALAVGQNPRGAVLVGHSIFPGVGSPYTLKSFCLIATAGVGNLPGLLWAGLGLGTAEALVSSFRGYGGWADLVFFALLIVVIMVRSYRRRVT